MFAVEDKDVKRVSSKLHRQFGHPTADKLISLIKNSGCNNEMLKNAIIDVTKSCVTCCKFRKPVPRPVVSLPMASQFNETISMDLKSYNNVYFLVLVDLATRYCAAIVIGNKLPSTVIKGIFMRWISIFGTPRKILSDNGGEFSNCEMRDMCEKFNIRLLTTSAESPWSNGVCERLNAVIGSSVDKIRDDSQCDLHTALAWAVSARNALINNSGFSPNQLVFGFNPSYPCFDSNDPPAFEIPSSQIVEKNLIAMRKAKENFLKIDSNERLNRAMRHNIRESEFNSVNSGDHVFYKRNDSNEWRGPAVVIGRDGSQILVKHAGMLVRVHSVRLRKSTISNTEESMPDSCEKKSLKTSELEIQSDNDDEPSVNPMEISPVENSSNNTRSSTSETMLPYSDLGEQSEDVQVNDEFYDAQNEIASTNKTLEKVCQQFVVGQRINGVNKNSGELISGTIISRAGKAKGQYKDWYNVKKNDDSVAAYDLRKDFESLEIVSDNEEMLVLHSSNNVMKAKELEMENWRNNNVFEEVENCGQNLLSLRWVVTEKLRDGNTVIKARLVARGFEEDTREMRKDSPTCSREAVRLTIALASSKRWICHSLDIKAAFLQGSDIDREVYVKPPPEFFNDKIWRLKKTIYGLSDAARAWYLRVKTELTKLKVKVSKYDSALFTWKSDNDGVEGVICVYVDDFLWAGTQKFEEQIIRKLEDLFLIGSSGTGSFKYIGLRINNNCMKETTIDQLDYASTLKPIPISCERAGKKLSELSSSEKVEYRSLIGQLNWIGTQTRPDILFDVGDLCSSFKNATVGDILRLNKVLSRLCGNQIKISFPIIDNMEECFLQCYSDASFANLSDSGSQIGFVIFLSSRNGARCPIYWQSKKARRVIKSTLAAETMALIEGAETAIYISHIISDMLECPARKIHCFVDNKSLVDTLYSSHKVEEKRLRVDMAVFQDMMGRGEVTSVSWVDTEGQLANCLTKRGASAVRLMEVISPVS